MAELRKENIALRARVKEEEARGGDEMSVGEGRTLAKAASASKRRIRIMQDSLERAHVAVIAAQRLTMNTTTALQERATAYMSVSTQLGEEAQVLSAAKEFCREMSRQ